MLLLPVDSNILVKIFPCLPQIIRHIFDWQRNVPCIDVEQKRPLASEERIA